MVYNLDFIYNIYWVTDVIDGVRDDIVWIKGMRMPWFNSRLGPEKEKSIHLIYVLYILYVIYIVYILYAYFIYIYIYIACIRRVKSEWYINRTSFTTYTG